MEEQEQEKAPKLKDIKESRPKKIGPISAFLLIIIALGAFFLSPAPTLISSYIPDSFYRHLYNDLYRYYTLDESGTLIDEPKKFAHTSNLPILGRNTGLCFEFSATPRKPNNAVITEKQLEDAKRGISIAEVIAVSPDKKEYTMDDITITHRESGYNKSIICQKFHLRDSILPEEIEAIYVRPLKKFKPEKVLWATAKDVKLY